ncbi:MAG: DUF4911 domain-containing protein [Desulfatitalea sp.]
MKTSRQYYRVDRHQINMVKFIFEAYEGIAVVTTLDAAAGWIVLAIAPGCEPTAQEIMVDMGKHFLVESCNAPPAAAEAY